MEKKYIINVKEIFVNYFFYEISYVQIRKAFRSKFKERQFGFKKDIGDSFIRLSLVYVNHSSYLLFYAMCGVI
jgi:hypothetical protein